MYRSKAPQANKIQNNKTNTTNIKKSESLKLPRIENLKIQNCRTLKIQKISKIQKSIFLQESVDVKSFGRLDFWIFAVVHRCLITVMDKLAKCVFPRVVGGAYIYIYTIYIYTFIHTRIYVYIYIYIYIPIPIHLYPL